MVNKFTPSQYKKYVIHQELQKRMAHLRSLRGNIKRGVPQSNLPRRSIQIPRRLSEEHKVIADTHGTVFLDEIMGDIDKACHAYD